MNKSYLGSRFNDSFSKKNKGLVYSSVFPVKIAHHKRPSSKEIEKQIQLEKQLILGFFILKKKVA
jgi:hypothetical protein